MSRSNVWNTSISHTNDWSIESLPTSAATPSGLLKFGSSLNGGAYAYPFTFNSNGTFISSGGGNIQTSGDLIGGSATNIYFLNRALLSSPADGQLNVNRNNSAAGIGLDVLTDGTLKLRTRAQTANAALSAGADALASTSTDGIIVANDTLSTGGATVQMSPRLRWRGHAWDTAADQTVDFFAENLPATAATPTGTWKLGYSLNGAAATYPLTLTSAGVMATSGNYSSGGSVQAAAASALRWSGRVQLLSGADKLLSVLDAGVATGLEVTVGSATLGTCTGGTITTGSHNFAGGYTGNTSSSCIVNFGTPAWTNAPFCIAHSIASTTHPRISAVSTASMTVTGGVSGEAITFLCVGRIGT